MYVSLLEIMSTRDKITDHRSYFPETLFGKRDTLFNKFFETLIV